MNKFNGFIREMVGLFGNFLMGGAVVRINDPHQLYQFHKMLRHSLYNFFNTTLMTDADLLAYTASRNLKHLDLSRDANGNKLPLKMKTQILLDRAIYYYMADNYDFYGFPVYFRARTEGWDDNQWTLDRDMLQIMGAPEKNVIQIEMLYSDGDQLLMINEFNPATLINSPKIPSSLWKFMAPTQEQQDAVDHLIKQALVNRLNDKKQYEIAMLSDPTIAMVSSVADYVNAQRTIDDNVKTLNNSVAYMMTVDDPCGNDDAVSKIMQFLFTGTVAIQFFNKDDVKKIFSMMSFVAKGDIALIPIPDPGENGILLWYDGRWGQPQYSTESLPEGIEPVKYSELAATIEEWTTREVFIYSMCKNLMLTYPILNAAIPPLYVHSIRDEVYEELSGDKSDAKDLTFASPIK